MTLSTIGPLRVRSFGGSDRRGGGDGPAILLCHGFGAPGDDLCSLARVVPVSSGVRWFFPEAPLTVDFGSGMQGRAWWPIDMIRLQEAMMRGDPRVLRGETPPGMAEARSALEGCIEALERDHGVARDRLVIGGFSQGGMVTTEVALHAARPFAGLVVMSGTLLCEDRWQKAGVASAPKLHALMSHGRADPLLPFGEAVALKEMLEAAGASVAWVPHNGQHEIPMIVLQRLGTFAGERFGLT
jgi:phospholipase/carboxylesterase